MSRRRLLAAAAAAPVLAGLAACGGKPAADAGTGRLTFSYLWTGAQGETLAGITKRYDDGRKDLTIKTVSNPDQQAQLAAMSSATASFDISDSFDNNTGAWGSKGILEPLDSYLKADGYDLGDFVPAVMDQMKYEGTIYQLPIAVHTQLLVYSKQLFAEAGITAPPKTWEEVAQIAPKLTKVQGGRINQLALAQPPLQTMALTFGGRWYDDDGRPTPDDPGNVAALKFYVDTMVKPVGAEAYSRFKSGAGSALSEQDPFFTGKVAMQFGAEYIAYHIARKAPDLEWGVVALPHPAARPELAGTSSVSASTLFVPRNSRNKKLAWELITHLLSPEPMVEFTHALANLPTRKSTLDDPKYRAIANFDAWLEQLRSPNLQSTPSLPVSVKYNNDLTTAVDQAILGQKTPEQALGDLAKLAKGYPER